MPDLVIFDCDGVLVDSEILAGQVLAEKVAQFVPQIDKKRFAEQAVGRTDASVLADTAAHYQVSFPPDMHANLRLEVDRALAEQLQPVPGVADMLEQLALPRAIASNSSRARILRSLGKTGLRGYFGEDLFGADMVDHPKPAPDLYLLALARTGHDAERAIVVEDSIAGLRAARAAGLRVIGFTGASGVPETQADQLKADGAETVIDDMRRLPAMLSALTV